MQEQFLETVEQFRARHSLTEHGFALKFCGDGGWYQAVRAGRQVRGTTMAKISERMSAFDEAQKLADAAALSVVRKCGFVVVENGEPRLESDTQIETAALKRLIADGALIPSGDAFLDCPSQTYRPAHAS